MPNSRHSTLLSLARIRTSIGSVVRPSASSFEFEFDNSMAYDGWDNSEAKLISIRHKFCMLEYFGAFLEQTHGCDSRSKVIAAYRGLRCPAPFSQYQRFPGTCEFVDLDHNTIRPWLQQLIAACESPDRNATIGSYGHDAKRSFDVSLHKLKGIYTCSIPGTGIKYGIYDRATFETKYGLVWQE